VRLRVLLGGSCFFDFFDLLLLPFFSVPFLPPPDVDFLPDEVPCDFFLGLEDGDDLEEPFLPPVLATAFLPPLEDVFLLFLVTAERLELFFPDVFLADEEEETFFDFFGELELGDLAFFGDEDDFFVLLDPERLVAAVTPLAADEEAFRPAGRIFFAAPTADLAS
jgi:hypothetical protein